MPGNLIEGAHKINIENIVPKYNARVIKKWVLVLKGLKYSLENPKVHVSTLQRIYGVYYQQSR